MGISASGELTASGASSVRTVTSTVGDGGRVELFAWGRDGTVTLRPETRIDLSGGCSSGTAGGGGEVHIETPDGNISIARTILVRGGRGGLVSASTDTDLDGYGGDITIETGALVDASGGDVFFHGHAEGDPDGPNDPVSGDMDLSGHGAGEPGRFVGD